MNEDITEYINLDSFYISLEIFIYHNIILLFQIISYYLKLIKYKYIYVRI